MWNSRGVRREKNKGKSRSLREEQCGEGAVEKEHLPSFNVSLARCRPSSVLSSAMVPSVSSTEFSFNGVKNFLCNDV